MKKEEQDNNLNDAEEAKNALRELADITVDKYVVDKKKSNEQKKKQNKGRKSI